MPLESGARLGHYEVLAPIGAGGMGEVYKARDPRLNRTVAIKVLPAHIIERAELRDKRPDTLSRAPRWRSSPRPTCCFSCAAARC
jgi:serine/threonine protein kinase